MCLISHNDRIKNEKKKEFKDIISSTFWINQKKIKSKDRSKLWNSVNDNPFALQNSKDMLKISDLGLINSKYKRNSQLNETINLNEFNKNKAQLNFKDSIWITFA